MSELDVLKEAIYRDFEAYATGRCVRAIKSAFAPHNRTGKTVNTFHARKVDETTYFVGSSDQVASIIYTGRREVTPLHADWLRYADGSFHKYSSPVAGDDYVSRAISMLGG